MFHFYAKKTWKNALGKNEQGTEEITREDKQGLGIEGKRIHQI